MSPINITIKIQDWLKGLYSTDNACVITKNKKVNWSIKALSVLFFFTIGPLTGPLTGPSAL